MLNLNQLKRLYTNSPLWMKKLYASIPYDIRSGAEYRKWKKILKNELNEEEYQLLKLKETLIYAYENTLYYKREFDKHHINVYEFNKLEDLQKIPFINKDIVRENYNDMVVKDYPKNKTFFVTTGGSSGEAMKFLQSKNIWAKEWAFGFNLFNKYDYNPNILKASFRGGDFINLRKNTFWKYNPIHNEIHFSPFALNLNTVKAYVEKLNYDKPTVFHSYPSSLLLLINCMIETNHKLNYKLNLIILISENYSNEDIKIIKEFFNCRIITFYGHSEHLIFAPSITDELNQYSIDNRYGFCELIDSNNKKIINNNIQGELVGTSFDNFAMPLIRYKTEDFTQYIDFNNSTVSLIKGRWTQDYLDGTNGSKIYLTALNMHSDIFSNVIQFQFIQNKKGNADFLIITKESFNTIDEKNILIAFQNKVGNAITFNIKKVTHLSLSNRGKAKKIIKNDYKENK